MSANRPPFLRRDARNSIWLYRRPIPENLRQALGGKKEFVRSLGVSTDRFTSKEFRRAYAKAESEAEALFKQVQAPVLALTDRDRFGLMRELLLAYEMTDQQALIERRDKAVPRLPGESDAQWTQRQLIADVSIDVLLLNEVVQRLKLTLTPAQASDLLVEFQQHKDVLLQTRSKELKEFNFNSVGGILERLPEPPSQVITWEALRNAWITRKGGRRSEGGRGLAEGSIDRADKHWSEIQLLTQVANPTDLTTDMVRQWIKWMQERLVPTTVLSNLKIMKAVLRVGVSEGLLEENVAENLMVIPEEVEGYLPFEPQEVRLILDATTDVDLDYMHWLPRLALYTGARIEELAQLRGEDVREINGVQCLDFVHRPEDELPTFLKGKLGSERQVPIHPWVIKQGFLQFCEGKDGRLFKGNGTGAGTVGPSASRQFRLLLIRLGVWVKRKKVFHSFRGTFKDNCRRAGIAPDVHHALTGHSPGNVGDKAYGLTLRKMPEVTVESVRMLPTPNRLKK